MADKKLYRAIHIRDFLRGGYQQITEETIVTKHGRPIGRWVPMGIPIKEKTSSG